MHGTNIIPTSEFCDRYAGNDDGTESTKQGGFYWQNICTKLHKYVLTASELLSLGLKPVFLKKKEVLIKV